MISADLRNLRRHLTSLAREKLLTRELFEEAMTQLEVIAQDVEELELRQVSPPARLQGSEDNVVRLADRRPAAREGRHA